MHVLVDEIIAQSSESLLECSLCALRNMCVGCVENQEELSRCNGMTPVLKLLHSSVRKGILEIVTSLLVKVGERGARGLALRTISIPPPPHLLAHLQSLASFRGDGAPALMPLGNCWPDLTLLPRTFAGV